MDNGKLLFFIIFIVISIVQSIVKKVNESREAQKANAPPVPVRPLRPVADDFLTTARRRNSSPDHPMDDATPAMARDVPDSLPMAPRSPVTAAAPTAAGRNSGSAAQKQQRPRTGNPRKKSEGSSGADKKANTRTRAASDGGDRTDSRQRSLPDYEPRIGSSLGQHVDSFLARRPSQALSHLDEHVRADMSSGLRQESTSGSAALPSEHQLTAAESIINARRNPVGVRQAMMVNEVLSRPKIFRR
ncbi:MAG: hypothetical protein ACK526_21125 [Planctomyces sp.]